MSLDYFKRPSTDTVTLSGKDVEYQPLAGLNDAGPFEWLIAIEGNDYIYLPSTRLIGNIRIKQKANGTVSNITSDTAVALVNLGIASIIKHIELKVNGILVTDNSSNTYAYKHYLECALNYGKQSKDTHLFTSLWEADTSGKFDSFLDNAGYINRAKWSKNSIDFVMPLMLDFLSIEKLWPSDSTLGFKITRNADEFSLMVNKTEKAGASATDDPIPITYSIHIEDIKLVVRRVQLQPSVHSAIQQKLNSSSMAYFNFNRVVIKNYLLMQNVQSKILQNICRGDKPSAIIIFSVSSEAYNGSLKKNCFHLQHFNLEQISLVVDGVQYPNYPLVYNGPNDYACMYNHFINNCGIGNTDDSNGITSTMYFNGYHMHPFDLSALLKGENVRNQQCQIDLHLRYKNPLPENIQLFVMEIHPACISLDSNRQLKFV